VDCTFYAIRETFYYISSLKNRKITGSTISYCNNSRGPYTFFSKHPVREGKHNGKGSNGKWGTKTERNKYRGGSSFV